MLLCFARFLVGRKVFYLVSMALSAPDVVRVVCVGRRSYRSDLLRSAFSSIWLLIDLSARRACTMIIVHAFTMIIVNVSCPTRFICREIEVEACWGRSPPGKQEVWAATGPQNVKQYCFCFWFPHDATDPRSFFLLVLLFFYFALIFTN